MQLPALSLQRRAVIIRAVICNAEVKGCTGKHTHTKVERSWGSKFNFAITCLPSG